MLNKIPTEQYHHHYLSMFTSPSLLYTFWGFSVTSHRTKNRAKQFVSMH